MLQLQERRAVWVPLVGVVAALMASGCGQVREALPNLTQTLSQTSRLQRASGSWSLTGSLKTPRVAPMAVTLSNGKVLVAGGLDNSNQAIASAELYDPKSSQWSRTASMSTARVQATVTLLQNKKVLVAGGETATGLTASAEIYNPSAHRWSPTGSMTTARANHTATLLSDGRVLVAGGFGYITDFTQTVILQTAEIFDPSSASWRLTGNMNQPRAQHAAVALTDGRALVAGEYDFGPQQHADRTCGWPRADCRRVHDGKQVRARASVRSLPPNNARLVARCEHARSARVGQRHALAGRTRSRRRRIRPRLCATNERRTLHPGGAALAGHRARLSVAPQYPLPSIDFVGRPPAG
jgi:hypothetical protein